MLSIIEKNQHTKPGTLNVVDSFRFQTEERIQCVTSGKVRYTQREDNLFALPVPLNAATNKSKYKESCVVVIDLDSVYLDYMHVHTLCCIRST